MKLYRMKNRSNDGYTTFGSVWNRNEVRDNSFILENEMGEYIPVQTRVTAFWPDGSIKWAAHTADSGLMGECATIKPLNESISGISDIQINIEQKAGYYYINTGKLSALIPYDNLPANNLAEDICIDSKLMITEVYPVLNLERRSETETTSGSLRKHTEISEYRGKVETVKPEETGPLQCVFRFEGKHYEGQTDDGTMPFVIRMYFNAGSEEIRFVHTFFYDGTEERDFLKGMGICFDAALTGKAYNRHVKFGTDRNYFHEAAVLLNSNYPRLPLSVLEKQMRGEISQYSADSDVEAAMRGLPVWDRYLICQNSPFHYLIKKQTKPQCCMLDCMQGHRAPGIMAVTGEAGGLILGVKDFWRKHPAGLEADGLGKEKTKCMVWFYSPEASAYDFRHYSTESYQMTSYEGFEELGACAYGISVTSECRLALSECVPSDDRLAAFAERVQKPAVYVGASEYYHDKKAFGNWSLMKKDTQAEVWLEEQLEKAVDYYIAEVENRNWYGLFDYGDFMHAYDSVRHCWRYDMGGYAWQNTELVPTYWLWLYFLRTGREDVYTLAEAMSRHCSEVDFYHFGPMKGIGSRHNVRHWGCSCKEPRVSMAGHHRFFYYLTGDYRIGDVFDDVKDADKSMVNIKYFKDLEGRTETEDTVIRSGPDWSSFVANWMTEYERTLDSLYRDKIETGISDISKTPLGLASGPFFVYNPSDSRLIYKGEDDNSGNMHLQICMGGPEIWSEAADMLENETLKRMLINHGRFYYLSKNEKEKESGGLISNRPFSFPYFAASLAAYSAFMEKNEALAKSVWEELLYALMTDDQTEGFKTRVYAVDRTGKELTEIPWIKTNFSAQWCLNIIVSLDFIREYLPKTLDGMKEMLLGKTEGHFRNA